MNAALLAVLAGLCWGVGEVFTRSVLHAKAVGPLAAIAIRSTVALPLLWAVWAVGSHGLGLEPPGLLDRADGGSVAKLVLGSGVVAGAGGMALFYAALSLGEVSRVKPIAFSVAPATAVVLGAIFLGEALSLPKVLGLVLILGGVLLLTAAGR